jgi:hypothetical protein
VLAGFLAADLLLEGMAAAVVVCALGALEFALLAGIQRRAHYDVLLEGVVLSAILLVGDRLSDAGYEGAGFALMETVLGLVLGLSARMGKPILDKQLRRMTGLSMGERMAARVSSAMGLVLVAHSVVLWVLILTSGRVGLPVGAGSFVALYVPVVLWLRRGSEKATEGARLEPCGGNEYLLVRGEERLAKISLSGQSVVDVVFEKLYRDVSPHELLADLEEGLAGMGIRTLRLPSWGEDTLPLEISGFTRIGGSWQKVLPIGRARGGPR